MPSPSWPSEGDLEWLTIPIVLAIHDEQLTIHGGSAGLRDVALLELALNRPLNKWNYEQAEMPELAAAYGYGIARNHPFIDGNKRTALLAIYTFLGVNGVDFIVPEADAAAMILSACRRRGERRKSRALDWRQLAKA